MISFLTVIFLPVAVLFIVIFNLFDFCLPDFLLVTYLICFINRQYLIRQVVFVRLSSDISVELFVVLFSIFVVFEVGVYFIIIFISTLHLQYNIALHWYNFYYFNQHRQDNKPINLSTNKTNQSTNLSVLVIFLAKLYLLNRTNHNKIKPNLNYKTNFR